MHGWMGKKNEVDETKHKSSILSQLLKISSCNSADMVENVCGGHGIFLLYYACHLYQMEIISLCMYNK